MVEEDTVLDVCVDHHLNPVFLGSTRYLVGVAVILALFVACVTSASSPEQPEAIVLGMGTADGSCGTDGPRPR